MLQWTAICLENFQSFQIGRRFSVWYATNYPIYNFGHSFSDVRRASTANAARTRIFRIAAVCIIPLVANWGFQRPTTVSWRYGATPQNSA